MDDRRPDAELLTSLALDDEIDHGEMLALLDAVAADPGARDFWRRARRAESQIDALRAPRATATRPTPRRAARPTPRPASRRWIAAVVASAAVALIAVSTHLLPVDRTNAGLTTADPVQVRLGEDPQTMDDARFVAVAVELLRADRRYRAEMADLLDDVGTDQFVPESESHTRRGERETRIARSETGDEIHRTVSTATSVPAAF